MTFNRLGRIGHRSSSLTTIGSWLLALVIAESPPDETDYLPDIVGRTDGSSVTSGANVSSDEWPDRSGNATASETGAPRDRYQRHAVCDEWFIAGPGIDQPSTSWDGDIPDCITAWAGPEDLCPEGATPALPLWVSRYDETSGQYGPWTQVSGYSCPADPLPAAILAEWRRMSIEPTEIAYLPELGWAIARLGVTPSIDDSAQMRNLTVLGTPVTLRATPVEFAWSTSDGASVETGSARLGEPLTFEPREHRVTVALTTTWEGHYSLDGGSTWLSAPGTATTTSAPSSLHVFNPSVRLVNCDTAGDCQDGKPAPAHAATITDPDSDGIDNHTIPDEDIADYLDARASGRTWHGTARIYPLSD
ncbi:hypothetical protein [Demequina sp. NBRC 110053]|uniref:hypothetical protein n=1 Tax=Demequina sp. NBRC 110053 TaxID=1570342 RepID=UPI001186C582|nr:hypothetical protein [Demequina sp. NBRC 110053]